jgi:putative nucleotidyltransferase with HDIG domain
MEKAAYLQKLDEIKEIPTLPIILNQLNRMLGDDDTTIRKLSRVFESDQAITARILKLVNSAFYGFRSKISNIPHALVILGFNSVRNAIVSVSIFDAFGGKQGEAVDGKEFWKHSVAVAVISKYLAGKTRLVPPDDSFVAGLLHDIGKILIAQYFQETFQEILETVHQENLTFYEAEKKRAPFTHAQIGGHFAQKWQFPQGLVEAIEYHHSATKNGADPALLLIVHFADQIAHDEAAAPKIAPELSSAFPEILKILTPHLEKVADWFPFAAAEAESACKFFLQEEGA